MRATSHVRALSLRGIHTLTFNTGSSSLKYSLYDINRDSSTNKLQGTLVSTGMAEKVSKPDVALKMDGKEIPLPKNADHDACFSEISKNLPLDLSGIKVVGHRVVHGGADFTEPAVITPEVLESINQNAILAPLHNPPAIIGINSAQSLLPSASHVAVFDTSFHSTMPASSYRYALPRNIYEDLKVRRYGFHGTSYKYITETCATFLNNPSPNLIILHLGSGASMCCVKDGVSIDTTMGLTPVEGLVMGTRSGDIDPGIILYLMDQGYSREEVDNILNKKSGLLGLSGTSNDFRSVSEAAAAGHPDAKLAIDVFVERVRKYLGAYMVKLGGQVDAVVFTGGIGENAENLRSQLLDSMDTLGVELDSTKNSLRVDGVNEIGSAMSKTRVLVVPTNEELSIALQSVEASGALGKPKTPQIVSRKFFHPQTFTNASCRSLFVYTAAGCYSAIEEVSLLQTFASRLERCGYFRCIAKQKEDRNDYKIDLMREHFKLDCDPASMFGVTADEAIDFISHGKTDQMYEKILDKYLTYAEDKDFVLVSSTMFGRDDLNISARLAQGLGIPAVLIADQGKEEDLVICKEEFSKEAAKVAGVIVSGVKAVEGSDGTPDFKTAEEQEREKLSELGLNPVAILPYEDALKGQTIAEVASLLNGEILYGKQLGGTVVKNIKVLTLTVENFLEILHEAEGALVVSHCTRTDVLLSLLLVMCNKNVPKISGILLTSYRGQISPKVLKVLDGLGRVNVPILVSAQDTWNTASAIKTAPVFITADSIEKISVGCALFDQYLSESFINRFIDNNDDTVGKDKDTAGDIGPKLFQHFMFAKARALQKTLVLPEGSDIRIVEAASRLTTQKLCKIILLGNPSIIAEHKTRLGVDLGGVTIINPEEFEKLDEMVEGLYQARKKKGMTRLQAKDLLLQDVNYFGTMMMHLDLADGMVSGAAHSTASTIRPPLQIIKTAPGISTVCSTFFMLLPGGVKCFGDCALNVEPNAHQLAEIAVSQAKTAIQFGMSPRVALLSYATGDSNSGELIDKIIEATDIARDMAEAEGFMKKEMIEGPLQFDAAVDPVVAAIKTKDNPVAGRANVLVYPDLNAGNTGYKSVQQASKCVAVGPILLGLNKPVNDLSRGAKVADIVNTAVITCIQAGM
mmetsp:Transcript_6827/g.9421  ORF Transcript_6827/g.9421 Transcript_6827/m.9421 type:complete len:1143 (+) Transcript_6827:100-3528(+)|eukprot:CAMPEP_0184501390 /NCGR_PEP_ID=MMETSP0113_2-20130426/47507_1 /TAXON_ID=91329 /ORGANISM="Norrisiella sphaerica, Strain BC52" /LENGTH=1142 /DNA_ID=CAMNT_0026890139 /DNA_START=133 /DNA_END=3561 /DNA_ORIENTATION=+